MYHERITGKMMDHISLPRRIRVDRFPWASRHILFVVNFRDVKIHVCMCQSESCRATPTGACDCDSEILMCFVSCLSSVNVVSILKSNNVGGIEVFDVNFSSTLQSPFQLHCQFPEDSSNISAKER